MARMKPVLLVVCGVVLVVIVAWQQSANEAAASAKAPLQLMRPAPSVSSAAAPAAPSANVPAAVPAGNAAAVAVKKPATRRDVKSNSATKPVAITASHSNAAPAPLAPSVVKESTAMAAPVSNTEAYETEAAVRLKEGDYRKAGELFETALRNGGKATFTLIHDHSKGNFEKDPKATCVGELVMTPTEIKFEGADGHQFGATWAEVLDAGSNKFFGSGIGGFHVAINPDGKYKNINLAPRSKDKAEAKMIIDLLNASARGKTERGSK